jgi:hypothetical protein
MRLDITFIVMAFLGACRPAVVTPNIVTTEPTVVHPTGSVEINTPAEGAVIYSEVIALTGTAANLPEDAFALTLTGPDGELIASAAVRGASGSWGIELTHTYNSEPIDVTINAHSLDSSIAGVYAQRSIALAGLSYRPEGMFASIDLPANDSIVGGEFLLVTGTASGVPGYALTIDLIADDGRVIARTYASTANPYLIDDMPWTAELATHNHVGPATIQCGALNEAENTVVLLDSIHINMDTAAG